MLLYGDNGSTSERVTTFPGVLANLCHRLRGDKTALPSPLGGRYRRAMPTTFQLRAWTRFRASPEQVWALKTDPQKLGEEFRPWLQFSADPEALSRALAGAVPASIEGRLRFLGLPPGIAWPIEMREAEPPRRYTDASENSLYRRFEHTHLVESTTDGARYLDHVVFEPSFFPKLVGILTERIFVHRHRVAARSLEADPQVTGVTVLRVLAEDEVPALSPRMA